MLLNGRNQKMKNSNKFLPFYFLIVVLIVTLFLKSSNVFAETLVKPSETSVNQEFFLSEEPVNENTEENLGIPSGTEMSSESQDAENRASQQRASDTLLVYSVVLFVGMVLFAIKFFSITKSFD